MKNILKVIYFLVFFLVGVLTPPAHGEAIGVADVMRNADALGKDGKPLSSVISAFGNYDLRSEDEKKQNIKTVRVVVVGCVVLPGVYQVKAGTNLAKILARAGPITGDNNPVHSHLGGIVLYRNGQEAKKLSLNKKADAEDKMIDGDVLNILSVSL